MSTFRQTIFAIVQVCPVARHGIETAPIGAVRNSLEFTQKLSTVCTVSNEQGLQPLGTGDKEDVIAAFDTPSLSELVRTYLLKEMTSGNLKAGDRINEAEFARTLGISRNPIREAISGLAQQGYLVSLPRRGHRMRTMTAQDIDDVFSLRICLESFAIELALSRMTRRNLTALRAIQTRMSKAAEQGNVTDVREADIELHRTICEQSGNRQLLRAHEAIDIEIRILIACVDLQLEPLPATAQAHIPIVEARDAARSLATMQHHLKTTWAGVHEMYRRAGRLGFDSQVDDDPPPATLWRHLQTAEAS